MSGEIASIIFLTLKAHIYSEHRNVMSIESIAIPDGK